MGCSNARLLVQTPLSDTNNATNLNVNNTFNPVSAPVAVPNELNAPGTAAAAAATATDTNPTTSTRMHLTGVDLVVERNGSYTLLLTPRTHKQLMPYVLRKKRFRILVDKPRSEGLGTVNPPLSPYDLSNTDRTMESGKELKLSEKKNKKHNKQKMESTIEAVQQAASDELDKAKARFIGGRSIDRGDPEDEDGTIQSDDEGMIEEIVTTVEEDKDLECKVKKKIETKKTVAQDPETHNKITKVVKTEVTEITRTITINDQHDLERAKRELGIDDVNKLLPSTQIIYNLPSTYHSSSSWVDQPRITHVQEKYYEPSNEIVTSGDFPSDSPVKQHSPTMELNENDIKVDQPLADATTVGRGPVAETVSSSTTTPAPAATVEQKTVETKKKKKKSSLNLCSCTRSTANDVDEEQRKQKAATIVEQKSKQKKKASVTTTNALLSSSNLQLPVQVQPLVSDDIKNLMTEKKTLLIDYIHSKVFVPSKLFATNDQDAKGRKISSRIYELLSHDRCSSWTNLFEQLKDEYSDDLAPNIFIQPMVKTYQELFTNKQANILNTFATIHNDKDIKNLPENHDYITIVQTYLNERDNQPNITVVTKPFVENIEDTLERLQHHVQPDEKVISGHKKQEPLVHSKEIDMSDDVEKNTPVYDEEQLVKALAEISPHKPITLAEAIAYQYLDLDNPKLGLSTDTIERIRHLFRPLSKDDESTLNLIRINRAGQYLADFNLAETNTFERFHLSEPFIYQLQQSFEPTLDFSEKQFRSLTDAILNNKAEYSSLQFDIGRTLVPTGDMKESSTNDFSQSDSGYSMTTATYESLAGKVKNEFETINEPTSDQANEYDKTKPSSEYERAMTPTDIELQTPTMEEKSIVHLEPRSATAEPEHHSHIETFEEKPHVHLEPRAPTIEPVDVQAEKTEEKPRAHLQPRSPVIEPVDVQAEESEHKVTTHLEPRAPTIEPVDVQPELAPAIVHATKHEESTVSKITTPILLQNLHGAAVDLPEVELVEPGPLPTLTITKEKHKKSKEPIVSTTSAEKPVKTKKASAGLCASCFGAKAAEKKKKESKSETVKAPIEQKKVEEEVKKDEPPVTTIETTANIESSSQPVPTQEAIELSNVNIDNYQERTYQKSSESLPKLNDRLDATIEHIVPTEEPHYQLPSSEPVPQTIIENEYSLPAHDTYDVPRSIETPSEQNIQVNVEETILHTEKTVQVEKTSEDVISKEQKIESTIETMPNVEVKDSSTKGSYTLPAKSSKTKKVKEPKIKEKKVKEPKVKGEKKPGLFSNLFRHSDRSSKAPALDLPSVERDLSPNNELRAAHRQDSDPLRVPNVDLPTPDIELPIYDKPEVNMTTGQIKSSSSEFAIPSVNLPPIPDLHLPGNDDQPVDSTTNLMQVPSVQLPELEFTSNETVSATEVKPVETPVITEIKQESQLEQLPASPVQETLDIQADQIVSSNENDSPIPQLPKFASNDADLMSKVELLSTEQKYSITDTQFVAPPELPVIVEKQTIEQVETPPKLPDFTFELPAEEPVEVVSKNAAVSPPSFDDDVPSAASKIVPAIEVSTLPIKTAEKEVIETKTETKKKSSTLALCSCFGNKSNAQKTKTLPAPKEKSKPLTPPKSDLPEVDMRVPSSNISSTLKTKGSLHAPSTDLPPIDLTLPATEPVHLPTLHTHEKKRKAPKKPVVKEEKKVASEVKTSPEAVVPTPVNEVNVQQETTITPVIETKVEEQHTTEVPVAIEQVQEEVTTSTMRSPTPPPTVVEKHVEESIVDRPPSPAPIAQAQPVEEILVTSPIEKEPIEETKTESSVAKSTVEKKPVEELKESHSESKKHSALEIKAPAYNIPELDLSGPPKSDSYVSSLKHEASIATQSRSDSGLEAIISSHLHPSSTFGTNQTVETLNQHPSVTSGLGSDTIASITTKSSTVPDIQVEKTTTSPKRENSFSRHDFTRKISINDDLRSKLIFRQNDLKKCLEGEISKSIEDFDAKKDQKSLNKILTHAIDLIKDKKVTTYPELKQKLIVEHKNDAFIVDPVVRSLYCTIEKEGLDNLDKPEFPLAIRDMVRLPAKQTFDTVAHFNKDITEEKSHITKEQSSTNHSCLTCGRSKSSKSKTPSTPTTTAVSSGLLDDRRRVQLNTHRNELGTILRDHIQSSQPPIRQFPEHTKEVEKIIRKTLTLVTQPKILSYEQIRNDLKSEYKQTFYLVDPTVDIIRDTFDHCDITQMNEKTNLDILDSNITQTANLYNPSMNRVSLLTNEEQNLLKSNQLSWLNQYLIDNELKEKKITKKQNKELNKILTRAIDLLSLNLIYSWDELNSQLRREFSKAHDLCDRAVELIKQAQKDGLLLLPQSPNAVQQDVTSVNIIAANGKRRVSSLITDRARQNLKNNRKKIVASITGLLLDYNKTLYTEHQIENYVNKAFHCVEGQKTGQFKDYNDVKDKLKKDFKHNHEKLIEQIVDVIEQAHATNQFDDLDKPEVQTLMRDRLDGKPLVIKEMYVSLPPRAGAFGPSKYGHDDSGHYLSTSINGDRTLNSSTSSHRVGRGLSWREANERARILFYRGKHPAIHYDEQAAGFDVRMLLETTAGGTQEIPVTDSDVHELLNSCGVQWDGVNIISLVDHSEDVVRAAEQAALKVIREKGLVDLRTPPSARNTDDNDEPQSS
ncbi:unnamed protein product [Adineta ricciae]|uniref:Uncharacterized protein n=1 Tax=Adineta ricciae TaxID=249248 RepID=A0A814WMZ4_ADIRI|nr:unnamed protein product [Adineta ricciae]